MRYAIIYLETGEVVAEFEVTGASIKGVSGKRAYILTDEFVRFHFQYASREAFWRGPKNEKEILRSVRVIFSKPLYDVRPAMHVKKQ
jgi:hypothetical protein